jgi:hypothetical protein
MLRRVFGVPRAHQQRHLMRGLRLLRPEVPLHVVVAPVGVRAALLGVDEVREVRRVADEEHRRVVADEVVVALLGVELQREAARVARGVGRAQLAGDGREAGEHRRDLADAVEEVGARELRDVLGDLEEAVRARALGVDDALGDALAVELRHLLDDVVVLQQDRPVRADGQRVRVARRRDPRVGRGRRRSVLAHAISLGWSLAWHAGRTPRNVTSASSTR